jgi:arsenate reductase-like glutaredoxin family protein
MPPVDDRAGADSLGRVVEVQVFGTQKNQDTRKALRFFSERRVRVHFVDLRERAATRGELTRFVQKFGVSALIDMGSVRYHDLGLASARYSDAHWVGLLCDEPLLLRQPLTRFGAKLTIGLAVADWQSWVDGAKQK